MKNQLNSTEICRLMHLKNLKLGSMPFLCLVIPPELFPYWSHLKFGSNAERWCDHRFNMFFCNCMPLQALIEGCGRHELWRSCWFKWTNNYNPVLLEKRDHITCSTIKETKFARATSVNWFIFSCLNVK